MRFEIDPQISGTGIGLVGKFNPAILTPAWFVMCGLLPQAVAKVHHLQVAHAQVLAFSTEWLQIEVTHDLFQAGTTHEPYERLRDLVVSLFRDHLPHTPLTAANVSRDVHFSVSSADARLRVLSALAQLESWDDCPSLVYPKAPALGMQSLTVRQPSSLGYRDVTVESSNRIEGGTGLYVRVLEHLTPPISGHLGTEKVLEVLQDGFEDAVERSNHIVNHVMLLSAKEEPQEK